MASAPCKALAKIEAWKPEVVPPFPAVALRALNLMAGTNTSLLELCNLIRPDVAFSTEVLRIANSPLVAFPKNITNMLQASMVLGFRRLRNVVITVGLRAYLASPFTPLLQACWRHSLACAMIAERIAAVTSHDKDFAYTAGILHDIGRVAMAVASPVSYSQVAVRGSEQPQAMLDAERILYGMDHCRAGCMLVKTWELPAEFFEIISDHHNGQPHPDGVASIVALSCMLADSLGFGAVPYRTPGNYPEILQAFGAALPGFPSESEELASDLTRSIQLIESP